MIVEDVFPFEGRGTVVTGLRGPDPKLARKGTAIELRAPTDVCFRNSIADMELLRKGRLSKDPPKVLGLLLTSPVPSISLPEEQKYSYMPKYLTSENLIWITAWLFVTFAIPKAWLQRRLLGFFIGLLAIPFLSPSKARAADTLDVELKRIQTEHKLPALAGLMMQDGKIVVQEATGVRKSGSPEAVTINDQWHIGSCTKSMTATLAALFVEQGKIKWETTVSDIFPEWQKEMPDGWRGVTLAQLLTHSSGAPGEPPADLWAQAWKKIGSPTEQRLAFVHGLLTRPQQAPAGSKFIYSNQGYAIAGAMLERISGKPWEILMREMLFGPLDMKSAGFGEPASLGQVDQPWGHTGKNGEWKPIPPGPGADNPPSIGPAGTVHCSLSDLARYAGIHGLGEKDGWGALKPETFAKLHTPPAGQDYAMGWGIAERPWAAGKALTHTGSNTMFFTDVWVAPKKNAVFVSATNVGGDEAAKACDEVIAAMIQHYLK